MPLHDEYIAFVRDQLDELGDLRVKRMFGGAGIYSGETFFGILADDGLYLKVGDSNRSDYEARGQRPFSYRRKDGRVVLMAGYYPVPTDVLEDPPVLSRWARKALEVAAGNGIRTPRS